MISGRMSRRLLRHHLPIGLLTLGGAGLLYASRDYRDVITRLSFASAYPALLLVGLSLMIGPWKLLKRRRGAAISMDLRRDIGIWAGLASVFHAVIGNFEHLRGRPWLYYIYENWQDKHVQPFRHDEFGLGNFTGLFAALILLALLATSNDVSLRKLGTPGWKQLQRWVYGAFALLAVHTFTYQWVIKKPNLPWIMLAFAAIATTGVLQYLGYERRKAGSHR
ncbi:MAG: ferric reductase-like transmembrane domain-containing protein [Alphaproteobacteria bacterium]|nr:ferric reductase-like transmembrane domain-containing protein [Alphaproteobacteria bacterium]